MSDKHDKGNGLYRDVVKTIRGKRYDTSKAQLIGRHQEGRRGALGLIDFQDYEEALYLTPRSKTYFLAGRGGALTKWGAGRAGGQYASEGVQPLTADEAYSWAEKYLDEFDLEEWFGDRIEDA